MRARRTQIVMTLAVAAATFGITHDAWSKPKRGERKVAGVVTAHSRYGGGKITAPVRRGQYGPEVRLPGGTWISCKLDCKNTLREETIDFWKEQENKLPSCGRC